MPPTYDMVRAQAEVSQPDWRLSSRCGIYPVTQSQKAETPGAAMSRIVPRSFPVLREHRRRRRNGNL